ncbi:hypothetical protein C0995_010954 [Termitomyces sp. Mi166|nr:hypothetical protein C0995_010954 [Termitomyces sp. Mi166\
MRLNLGAFAIVTCTLTGLASARLGSSCSAPLGSGSSGPGDAFWMENIKHHGISAYHSNPGYQVFRNVKDFGAKGDGVTDDTHAIKYLTFGIHETHVIDQRSIVLLSHLEVVVAAVVANLRRIPIIALYLTQLVGDAKTPPTLLASSNFEGMAVIDADPYIPNGNGQQYYTNQNNLVPPEKSQGTGIHWQVAQATSLMNIVFQMSTAPNTAHQGEYIQMVSCTAADGTIIGIWMENGSGGFMGDLVFNGGEDAFSKMLERIGDHLVKENMECGSEISNSPSEMSLSTVRKRPFSAFGTGGININNCQVRAARVTQFDPPADGFLFKLSQSVGAIAIIDSVVTNTAIFVRNSKPSDNRLAGSLVINNARLNNVQTAVGVVGGATVLSGGTRTIKSWGQGNVYKGTNPNANFVQGDIYSASKPGSLLDGSGRIFGRMHPQYASYAASEFVSVRDHGAKGDGRTDDTAALKAIFDKYAGCKIVFFDAGTYIVTSTLTIPAGTRVVGEAWSVISGSGTNFQDAENPQVVVRVGEPGSQGILEITDMIFSTVGPAPGAIVVEWNVRQPAGFQGGAGTWDTHIRLGGAAGTNLEMEQCPSSGAGGVDGCHAAFLALHIKPTATAYLEGLWAWLADHDLDGDGRSQVSIYSGRGILSESAGPVWMVGTGSEHHTLYQYSLVNARNHYMGLIQTESPYYQPSPAAPAPFSLNRAWKDPSFPGDLLSAWALHVVSSTNIIVFGAGLYSFFSVSYLFDLDTHTHRHLGQNYKQDCLSTYTCQSQIVNIDAGSDVAVYSLSTVGTTYQVSVDGRGVVGQSGNRNGFASTVTAWSRGGLLGDLEELEDVLL